MISGSYSGLCDAKTAELLEWFFLFGGHENVFTFSGWTVSLSGALIVLLLDNILIIQLLNRVLQEYSRRRFGSEVDLLELMCLGRLYFKHFW